MDIPNIISTDAGNVRKKYFMLASIEFLEFDEVIKAKEQTLIASINIYRVKKSLDITSEHIAETEINIRG
jgi:hypothetical protein